MRKQSLQLFALALALLVAPAAAQAATISFSPLTGSNGDVYTGHAEDGFILGGSRNFLEGHLFGEPIPSVYSTSATASLQIAAADGGLFRINSLDLAANNGSRRLDYRITGSVGGSNVYTVLGTYAQSGSGFVFGTVGIVPTAAVDRITIQLTDNYRLTSFNLDNIVVNRAAVSAAVPEPSAALCFAVGALVVSTRMRKRA